MASSINTVAELVVEIRHRNADRKGSLVGIDGALSAGKSTLARQLAAKLDARLFEGDLFLSSSKVTYAESLALDCLSKAMQIALAQNRPVIIESVMLRQVLAKLELTPSLIIYVRHCSIAGSPSNPKLLPPPSHEHETLQEANEIDLPSEGVGDLQKLPREVTRYHKLEHPQEQADIVFDSIFDKPHCDKGER